VLLNPTHSLTVGQLDFVLSVDDEVTFGLKIRMNGLVGTSDGSLQGGFIAQFGLV